MTWQRIVGAPFALLVFLMAGAILVAAVVVTIQHPFEMMLALAALVGACLLMVSLGWLMDRIDG